MMEKCYASNKVKGCSKGYLRVERRKKQETIMSGFEIEGIIERFI